MILHQNQINSSKRNELTIGEGISFKTNFDAELNYWTTFMYMWKNLAFNIASGKLAKFKDGCSTYNENFTFKWRVEMYF